MSPLEKNGPADKADPVWHVILPFMGYWHFSGVFSSACESGQLTVLWSKQKQTKAKYSYEELFPLVKISCVCCWCQLKGGIVFLQDCVMLTQGCHVVSTSFAYALHYTKPGRLLHYSEKHEVTCTTKRSRTTGKNWILSKYTKDNLRGLFWFIFHSICIICQDFCTGGHD